MYLPLKGRKCPVSASTADNLAGSLHHPFIDRAVPHDCCLSRKAVITLWSRGAAEEAPSVRGDEVRGADHRGGADWWAGGAGAVFQQPPQGWAWGTTWKSGTEVGVGAVVLSDV